MRIGRYSVSRAVAAGAVVALVVAVAAVGVAAQQQAPAGRNRLAAPGAPGMALRAAVRGMVLRGLRALDLTDAQREQIKGVMQASKDDFKAVARDMVAARRALNVAVTADAVDEAAIRAASAQVAEVEVRAALLRAKVHAGVQGVLTPEQQQKAKAMRGAARKRVGALVDRLIEAF